MRQARRSVSLWLIMAVTAFLAVCSGCGGGSGSTTPPAPTTLTAAQATAVATQMESAFVADSGLIGANLCPTPPSTEIGWEDYCTISVANSAPCGGGGSVGIDGLLTGNVDFTDTGTFTGVLTAAPTNCSIAGTALVVNGDPSLSVSGAVNFFYGGITSFAVTESGSVTYGPKPAGVCQTNLTITASFLGNAQHTIKSCTLTGTACAQTINLSCM